MSVGLFENVGKSFGYTSDNTFKKFLRWIGLAIVMCIPIVSFIADGIFLKVYRGEEPDFSSAGKSFLQGLLFFIISFIYMIIPIALFIFLGGASVITAFFVPEAAVDAILTGGGWLSIIVLYIAVFVFALILLPAQINFARKQSFGAAFKFGEIFGMIANVGWVWYILSLILVSVILIILSIILSIIIMVLSLIPVVGSLLGLIILALATPFYNFFCYKYYANLFE